MKWGDNITVEEIFKYFKSYIMINEGEDYAIIGIPFFHFGHDEGIAIRFSKVNGKIILSDCHSTIDYLDANGIDLEDYRDKLDAIMRKFNIYLDGNVFRMVIQVPEWLPNLTREVGYFLEAMTIIAHIDL